MPSCKSWHSGWAPRPPSGWTWNGRRRRCWLACARSRARRARGGPGSSRHGCGSRRPAGSSSAWGESPEAWCRTAHVRSTLGLDDDQTARLQTTEQNFEGQRQPIRVRQREISRALSSELASGTPNQDRVKQLINERQENQLKLQQLNRDEDREM